MTAQRLCRRTRGTMAYADDPTASIGTKITAAWTNNGWAGMPAICSNTSSPYGGSQVVRVSCLDRQRQIVRRAAETHTKWVVKWRRTVTADSAVTTPTTSTLGRAYQFT